MQLCGDFAPDRKALRQRYVALMHCYMVSRPTRRVLRRRGRGAAWREAEAGVDGVRRNVGHDFLFIQTAQAGDSEDL